MIKQNDITLKGSYTWRLVKRYKFIYVMLIPIALYFFVFSYYPLILGIIKSFQESKLIGTPKFVAFDNYITVIKDFRYGQALSNTLIIGIGTFIFQFIFGVLIALSLNEIKSKFVKSSIQTITYIPSLLSWSVVAGMWLSMLSPTGMINGLLNITGIVPDSRIVFMAEPKYTYAIYILTAAWKGAGYYAVLMLAAIVGIDPSVYEAASIDGASRIKQLVHIVVPAIIPTMKVITVLASMGILRNFDQVLTLQNSVTLDKSRSLLYHIYIEGITQFKFGTATAAATLVLLATILISFTVRKAIKYDDQYAD